MVFDIKGIKVWFSVMYHCVTGGESNLTISTASICFAGYGREGTPVHFTRKSIEEGEGAHNFFSF